MPRSKPPMSVEKIAGHVATESALTLIGALSGNPIGALLPVLGKSLASERQKRRVEAALVEINTMLETHEKALHHITDAQYKLINETILAFLHTTSEEKLAYLRRAVGNSLAMSDLQPEEADFLVRNFSFDRVQLGISSGSDIPSALVVPFGGREELVATGLISLGLLVPAGPTWDDSGLMRFSNVVAKVIVLLRETST